MPNNDGSGPKGDGSKTGNGYGPCNPDKDYENKPRQGGRGNRNGGCGGRKGGRCGKGCSTYGLMPFQTNERQIGKLERQLSLIENGQEKILRQIEYLK